MSFIGRTKRMVRALRYPLKANLSQARLIESDMNCYEKNHGYRFDFRNPVLFTEKMQWYKLLYRHPDLSRIVDKCTFKQYVDEKLGPGYVIQLYGCWDSIQQLKQAWPTLPNSFCLKSTISSEGKNILIVKEKSAVNSNELCRELEKWLDAHNTMLNTWCSAYYACKPRILAEAYVPALGKKLNDYKMFCFGGKPQFMYVAVEYQSGTDSPIVFYDLDWNKMNIAYGDHRNDADVEKPAHFNQMIEIAKCLSKPFPFVRVDFFETNEMLYVAEMTFYPGGGMTPYKPESVNKWMGELLDLPIEKG